MKSCAITTCRSGLASMSSHHQRPIIQASGHKPFLSITKKTSHQHTTPNLARTYSTTKDWSASQYLKFNDARTMPVRDLIAKVPLTNPQNIIDLGCGPGNSTAVLAEHYPEANISGMDSSPDMLATARKALPAVTFTQADLNTYTPPASTNLLFSNAVFQWLPAHKRIPTMQNLLNSQATGSVLAIQVPDNSSEPSHRLMRQISNAGPWTAKHQETKPALAPFDSPHAIYDALKPLCSALEIWHTRYNHVLANHQAIVEWVKGTGLRPYLDVLPKDQQRRFLDEYLTALKGNYRALIDGKVMLTYPRLFVVAVRG